MRDNPHLQNAALKLAVLGLYLLVVTTAAVSIAPIFELETISIIAIILWAWLTEELLVGLMFRINRDLEQYLTTKYAPDIEVDEARLLEEEDTSEILAELDGVIESIETDLRDLGVSEEELKRMKVEFDKSKK